MNLKRTWFCKCGWTLDEEISGNLKDLDKEGAEGKSQRFCSGCNKRTGVEWRVIENTDPSDELEEPSDYCNYCKEIKPAEIMNDDFENYSHSVCDYCLENRSESDADMDAQDIKWGKHKV